MNFAVIAKSFLEGIPEGLVITNQYKDFSSFEKALIFEKLNPKDVKDVAISVVIRTKTTNHILQVFDEEQGVLSWRISKLINKVGDLKGSILVVKNIANLLNSKYSELNVKNIMPRTVLLPLGVFNYTANITLCYMVVIPDDAEDYFNTAKGYFVDIESGPKLDVFSKMILPIIPITKGDKNALQ